MNCNISQLLFGLKIIITRVRVQPLSNEEMYFMILLVHVL